MYKSIILCILLSATMRMQAQTSTDSALHNLSRQVAAIADKVKCVKCAPKPRGSGIRTIIKPSCPDSILKALIAAINELPGKIKVSDAHPPLDNGSQLVSCLTKEQLVEVLEDREHGFWTELTIDMGKDYLKEKIRETITDQLVDHLSAGLPGVALSKIKDLVGRGLDTLFRVKGHGKTNLQGIIDSVATSASRPNCIDKICDQQIKLDSLLAMQNQIIKASQEGRTVNWALYITLSALSLGISYLIFGNKRKLYSNT